MSWANPAVTELFTSHPKPQNITVPDPLIFNTLTDPYVMAPKLV